MKCCQCDSDMTEAVSTACIAVEQTILRVPQPGLDTAVEAKPAEVFVTCPNGHRCVYQCAMAPVS